MAWKDNGIRYDLKTIFELRKTRSLSGRRCVARVLYHNGAVGLADSSGVLWPLNAKDHLPPVGSIVKVQLEAFRPDGSESNKYEDEGYFFSISDFEVESVPLCEWSNSVIADPVKNVVLPDLTPGFTQYISAGLTKREERLKFREEAIQRVRDFFKNRGFIHMETPTLVPSGGVENYLSVFSTQYADHRRQNWDLSLPTSPEFALKKLLAEGFKKVFQVAHSFRNRGELSKWHEPEFLMVEWYRAGASMGTLMDDTQSLVKALGELYSSNHVFPKKWPVFRVDALFKQSMGISLEDVQDVEDFMSAAKRLSHSITDSDDWDSIFCKLFMEKIEPFLASQHACFVTHYPIQMGALAEKEEGKPFALRFEAYLQGIEICNGYQELTDPEELERRFSETQRRRTDLSRDKVFENTMKYGLPESAGNALGLDRVVALLLGADNIRELYPVPFLSQFERDTVAPE